MTPNSQPTGEQSELAQDTSAEELFEPDGDHLDADQERRLLRQIKRLLAIAFVLLVWGIWAAGLQAYVVHMSDYIAHQPKAQALGRVQRVTYMGSPGTRTQLETETRTVLVGGYLAVDRGTAIELRPGLMENEICITGTDVCRIQVQH